MSGDKEEGRPKKVSTAELTRRWQTTRSAMRDAGLDFLLIENAASFFPGHVKWFTEMNVADGDPTTIIFPLNDEMTTITHGDAFAREPRPPKESLRGVKTRINVPMLSSLKDTGYLHAEQVVKQLESFKNCRIGLVGLNFMSVTFHQYVTSHLTSAKFVDATDLVDSIKAIKSDEEIGFIRDACRMQDELFQYAISSSIRPGRKNLDVQLDIRRRSQEMGGRNSMTMVGSAPPGTAAMFGKDVDRTIQEGDQIIILFENDSETGFWAELSRIICLGSHIPPARRPV